MLKTKKQQIEYLIGYLAGYMLNSKMQMGEATTTLLSEDPLFTMHCQKLTEFGVDLKEVPINLNEFKAYVESLEDSQYFIQGHQDGSNDSNQSAYEKKSKFIS